MLVFILIAIIVVMTAAFAAALYRLGVLSERARNNEKMNDRFDKMNDRLFAIVEDAARRKEGDTTTTTYNFHDHSLNSPDTNSITLNNNYGDKTTAAKTAAPNHLQLLRPQHEPPERDGGGE